ncbi:MAG TPA: cell surface protein SprA, partial [Longimicrobiales bacterium]|nr:cell surface protein SprA [Longimicrobiales bacterium]
MYGRLFTLSLVVAMPVLSGGAVRPAPLATLAAVDTILRSDLDRPPRAVRLGLTAAEDEPYVTLGMRRIRLAAGRGLGAARPSVQLVELPAGLPDSMAVEPLADAALRWRVARLGAPPGDGPGFLAEPAGTRARLPGDDVGRFVTDYADLALNVRSRMELGGNWTRFRPCDNQFRESCNPSVIPQLSPEVLFGVQVDGTIASRIRVDVDFDQAREFDAANRSNIFYEGHEDDLLQRLEVGDVNFNLPRSRFLTEGIPAGNFGFQAEGQVGALDFQTVWAQQRGDLNSRSFQLTGIGDQRGFVQEDTLVLDDADYVRGQFFFLLDPTLIDRYPHVDVLELDAASAPPSVVPGDTPIQLYRYEDDPAYQQQVEGFIQADAVADAGGVQVVESGWFRYLQEGLDYFVHPSGLWIALRAPLSREEMLAVTYITAVGDTVGDYNPERIHNTGGRPTLRLLKGSGASHQPGRPTWDLEMHQVYRVSGSPDVEQSSVSLTISLGELSAGRTFKRRPTGEDITFLRLLGLDEEAPLDALDASFVYQPGAELFADEPPVSGTFVIFPTLRPFAEPPPVPSLNLTETATAQILGDDANPRIYFEEDPFERDNAGRFRLTLMYRLRSQGVISSFSLGAFGIRDGSERIFLGDRLLTRGIDYEIDYDVGQVRLLEPDLLFAAVPDASVRVTWEQRSLFQVSPTQVVGLRTHADLGDGGGIDFLGLYQSERSVVSRPILGTEPGAALLGGLSGSYRAGLGFMSSLLEALPGLTVEGESALSVTGEVAVSVPNPNTRGRAFIDDFDAASQLPVSLRSTDWVLGSAPTSRDGAESVLPPTLDPASSAPLVWQHNWIIESSVGDSVGVHEGFFPRSDLDNQIRVAGSEVREPGLRLTFGRAPSGDPTAWRSITTSLSANGIDLTKTEFLEVYVSANPASSLVLDLGTVSEDAFFVDSLGRLSGPRPDGGQWGLGLLDQEADPRQGEIWSDGLDALGVWDESCVAERGRVYRVGDPDANCTRGNGRPDSEDLDSDGNLDTVERHLRYVVPLDGTSPYLERNNVETGTPFRLYRIPIREAVPLSVGGAVTEADLRAVRHLRITVVGPAGTVQLARMRLVGSRWIKRDGDGVLRGIAGDTLANVGRVEVSTVSRITEGAAYASPPGVLEELDDPTTAFAGQGIEFNEKSLGIEFEEVPPGGRAEVYHRFPQRPRNFLSYDEARLWVVARAGDFGDGRPNRFFLKVGSDAENFYLYRTPLSAPGSPTGITPADWLPELRIDFARWYYLRLEAEVLLSTLAPGPGDPPVEVWSPDSTYAVVLKDRGRAPNLAAVREISMGVWNGGVLPTSGEVWVDELRLGGAVRDPGLAGSLDVGLEAGGVLTSRLSVTNRGAFFRQLRDDPTYQTDQTLFLVSTLALDRWMPTEWGVDMPVTLELGRADQTPRFLQDSDLRADLLPRLRPTEQSRTRVGVGLRKRTPTANPWLGFLFDGLSADAGYTTSDGSTVTTEFESRALDAGVGWVREPEPREVDVVPDFA